MIDIIASFTVPENIGTTPESMLFILPLAAAIAVVYKATKLPEIKPLIFFKEAGLLFLSILVFIAIAAISLHVLMLLFT